MPVEANGFGGCAENDELRMGMGCPRFGFNMRELDHGPVFVMLEGTKCCEGGEDMKGLLVSLVRGG